MGLEMPRQPVQLIPYQLHLTGDPVDKIWDLLNSKHEAATGLPCQFTPALFISLFVKFCLCIYRTTRDSPPPLLNLIQFNLIVIVPPWSVMDKLSALKWHFKQQNKAIVQVT